MKKNRGFVLGILVMALAMVFGVDQAECSPATTFNGSTLAGTTWVVEEEVDGGADGVMKMKVSLTFSSDTQGTQTVEVTQWPKDATEEQKQEVTSQLALVNAFGLFLTITYDKTTKTGTLKAVLGSTDTFTVNVSKKELVIKGSKKGIYKLQSNPSAEDIQYSKRIIKGYAAIFAEMDKLLKDKNSPRHFVYSPDSTGANSSADSGVIFTTNPADFEEETGIDANEPEHIWEVKRVSGKWAVNGDDLYATYEEIIGSVIDGASAITVFYTNQRCYIGLWK